MCLGVRVHQPNTMRGGSGLSPCMNIASAGAPECSLLLQGLPYGRIAEGGRIPQPAAVEPPGPAPAPMFRQQQHSLHQLPDAAKNSWLLKTVTSAQGKLYVRPSTTDKPGRTAGLSPVALRGCMTLIKQFIYEALVFKSIFYVVLEPLLTEKASGVTVV